MEVLYGAIHAAFHPNAFLYDAGEIWLCEDTRHCPTHTTRPVSAGLGRFMADAEHFSASMPTLGIRLLQCNVYRFNGTVPRLHASEPRPAPKLSDEWRFPDDVRAALSPEHRAVLGQQHGTRSTPARLILVVVSRRCARADCRRRTVWDG